MSIYGYLNCHDCRQTLWLGKAVHAYHRPSYFHIGLEDEPPHWQREQLNQVLWKFLADHAGHRIDVRLEHEMSDEMFGYQDIGGDSGEDISWEAYLAGWAGLSEQRRHGFSPRRSSEMKAVKKKTPCTVEDFCHLVREDQKADLIDGVIYMASPDNTDANEVFMWLGSLMNLFVEEFDLGKVFGSRVAYELDEHNSPEPDIGFVRKGRLHLVQRGRVTGPPDLAVEIVSPESIERDYKTKRGQNEKAGVPEYWIVDEIEETVTLLRLNKKGKYREVKPNNGELHSDVLPGFFIRPEWLFRSPRPKLRIVFAEILARLSPPDS